MGNNSGEKQFFKNLRKLFLDIQIRNVLPKLESSMLNGVAIIAKTYIGLCLRLRTDSFFKILNNQSVNLCISHIITKEGFIY